MSGWWDSGPPGERVAPEALRWNTERVPRFLILVFLVASLAGSQSARARVEFGTENTLNGQGIIDINIKTRNYLMFGSDGFLVGPVFYFQRPYEGFQELIYGAGVRFGKEWLLGVDAALTSRKVMGRSSTGFAAAIVPGYAFSKHWHLSVPVIFRKLDQGELSPRIEASFLPYIGWRIGF